MRKVIATCAFGLLLMSGATIAAEPEDSMQASPQQSSGRGTVPTSDESSDRNSKNPELDSAPPPRPIVRDQTIAVPLPSQVPAPGPAASGN